MGNTHWTCFYWGEGHTDGSVNLGGMRNECDWGLL